MLGRSEEEFWEAPLKKIYNQIEIHMRMNSNMNKKSKNTQNSGDVVRMKVTD